MLRRFILLACALCLQASWAAEAPKKDSKPEPGTSVEMPFLVVPMSQDGNLLGYSYVASKLICTSPSACIAVRDKLAFIQDAVIREVNAKPVSLATDPKEVDRDQLNSRLTAAARRVVGAEKVRGMQFMEIKYAPLHPSDSTMGTTPADQGAGQGTAQGADPSSATGTASQKNASSQGATSKPASGPSH